MDIFLLLSVLLALAYSATSTGCDSFISASLVQDSDLSFHLMRNFQPVVVFQMGKAEWCSLSNDEMDFWKYYSQTHLMQQPTISDCIVESLCANSLDLLVFRAMSKWHSALLIRYLNKMAPAEQEATLSVQVNLGSPEIARGFILAYHVIEKVIKDKGAILFCSLRDDIQANILRVSKYL